MQPQGTVDHFISSVINADIDLDGSANGTISGGATYYSPVIHTTTIGPLEPGVTYFYRVSSSLQNVILIVCSSLLSSVFSMLQP